MACDYGQDQSQAEGFYCFEDSNASEGSTCDQKNGPWCEAGATCAGVCVSYCCKNTDCGAGLSCQRPEPYWNAVASSSELGVCLPGNGDADADADSDADADADSDADGDSDAQGDSDADGDSDSNGDGTDGQAATDQDKSSAGDTEEEKSEFAHKSSGCSFLSQEPAPGLAAFIWDVL